MGAWTTFAMVMLAILFVGGLGGGLYYLGSHQGTLVNPTNPSNPNGVSVVTTTLSSITLSTQDKQNPSTGVGYTAQQSIIDPVSGNGAWATYTSGTASFQPPVSVDLLLTNGTTYHNQAVPALAISLGQTTVPKSVQFDKNASVTEYVLNNVGANINNGGGATNQTAVTSGGSVNMIDKMTGTALASTHDMTCFFELSAGVNASLTPAGVTYGSFPLKSTSVPIWYNVGGVNSRVWIYDVPALTNSQEVDYTIGVNALSSGSTTKTIPAGSSLTKVCYSKEWFIDPGTNKLTFDIADSAGSLKSMAQYKFVVYFQ